MPLLMVIMLSLLAFGVLFFQVGRAAIFSTEAQTAADAAALGAVEDIKAQLTAQVSATGTSDLAELDPARIRAAAERYARKNKGTVIKLERRGVDVKVWTTTLEKLGKDARRIDSEKTRGVGARPGADRRLRDRAARRGGGNIGSNGGGGIKRIKDDEWKDLGDEISKPPTCGNAAKSNDLVTLGKLLREHGFAVAENAEMGDDPRPGVHAEGGFHYKCRHSGALDVNADNGPGTEKQIIDGIVGEVQKLGFRTIWQAAGHFDHIHIDVANSGAIGVGGGSGGAVGALEETGLDVKLIDWDASYVPFTGLFGGLRDRRSPTARTPTRAWRRTHLQGARRHERLAEGPPGGVRDRDRRVRRAQPPLRRPRLGRRLPAAHLAGLGPRLLDHGPRGRGARVRPPRDPDRATTTGSAGQLAQGVQISGYPLRYDQVAGAGARDAQQVLRGQRMRRLWLIAVLGVASGRLRRARRRGPGDLQAARPGRLRRRRPPCPGSSRRCRCRGSSRPKGAVAEALDDGAIGVVDPGGVVRIEPDTLDTASDITLVRLKWTSWDALGRGRRGDDADAGLPADLRDRRHRRAAGADRALRRQDV